MACIDNPKERLLKQTGANHEKFRGMMYFLAGVVFTLVTVFGFFSAQDVGAASGCIRTGLIAWGSVGDVPDSKTIKIRYKTPDCLSSAGYKVLKVLEYNDNHVRVVYEKIDH
jgi:hypothetical protein